MNLTDRMILAITCTGIGMILTFTPDCIDSMAAVGDDTVGERYCGEITPASIDRREDVTFIRSRDGTAPEIITFTDHGMTVNHTYTVTGQITMYQGRLEIVVNHVEPVTGP